MAQGNAAQPPSRSPAEASGYTVVARRYRPQRFEEVVGQDHIVHALRNALRLNRVTHAYLFSGTRGVGKTSVARIFAKCLNCVNGPTEEPCLTCDICQAIAEGQDVDVIEIDGASNNGVDSVRELRQNAGLRPSRARFKIYYIDEVHMLSTGAFNALLKTLEEPPAHVKFLFATTEPNKIPITVLSRCQRYDFAGITPEQIVETLTGICRREKIAADPEALRVLARRAGGSMRDAQSLLEQLLPSTGERLTVESVHRLLATASDERLLDLTEALADHDSARVLRQVEEAASQGVQPSDLLSGAIDYLRDAMVLAAGASNALLTATPSQRPRLQAMVERWSLDSIVAALQILAEARGRLRGSPHGRTIAEVALVRVARLENLAELAELVTRLTALEEGNPLPAVKKKPIVPEAGPTRRSEPPANPIAAAAPAPPPANAVGEAPPIRLEDALDVWPKLVEKAGFGFGKGLSQVRPTAILGPNILVIKVDPRYNWVAEECGTDASRAQIESVLADLLPTPVTLRFENSPVEPSTDGSSPPAPPSRRVELSDDPMVQKLVELFEARTVHLEVEEETPQP